VPFLGQDRPLATNDGQRVRRSFLIPSIPDLVFSGLAALQVAAASLILLNRDGDLPRHIAVGKVMLASHSLVRQDFFSHTAYGQPFLAYEWLSQLIFAAVYGWAGLDAVAVLTAVFTAWAYALIAGFLIRRRVAVDLVLVTVIAAAVVGMADWAARPHAFSFAASAVLLCLLEPGGRKRLLSFIPLFALWANLHPGFLFGLGILGLATVGDLFEAIHGEDRRTWWRAARYHGAALGLGTVATLLNPNGIALHLHSLGHLGNADVIPEIMEFTSPNFHTAEGVVFLGALLLIIAAIAVGRTRLAMPTLLILLATVALSLHSRRYIALFGIVTLPLIALALTDDWQRSVPRVIRGPAEALAQGDRLARRGMFGLALVGMLGLAVVNDHGSRGRYVATEFSPRVFPVDAVNFARKTGVAGNLYNEYMWGGYIALLWPEQRVFIDGFADFYGTRIFRDHSQVTTLDGDWRDVLARWKVDLVLVESDSRVAYALAREPDWDELYRDDVAALFRKRHPAPEQRVNEH
jgi:hypothetical protein